jgi:signal peptidase II
MPPADRRIHLYWWLSLSILVADQLTKILVDTRLSLYHSVPVIPGFMDLTHVRNAGVAFGILNEPGGPLASYQPIVTTALAAVALAGIAFYARYIRPEEWIARVGLSLILGGAVGNLVDRLFRHYVIDFVDVYFRQWHFWAFNVADAAITVGAAFVFFDLLFVARQTHHASDSL